MLSSGAVTLFGRMKSNLDRLWYAVIIRIHAHLQQSVSPFRPCDNRDSLPCLLRVEVDRCGWIHWIAS